MAPPPPAKAEPAGGEPVTPDAWDRALRSACRLAVAVAAEGERAQPRVAAPASMVPLMRHHRLSAAAYATIRHAIDGDGIFRARVADRATEAEVGRAGWLWLHRPVGWADDPAFSASADPPTRSGRGRARERDEARREALVAAEAARKQAEAEVASLQRANAELRASCDALRDELSELTEQRRQAVRAAKRVEAELAQARADLRVRKQALVDLEQELAAARAGVGAPEAPMAAIDPPATRGRSKPSSSARRRARPLPQLPPGVFDATAPAHRSLITSAANLVVVDGYNLARAAWVGLTPEEERRRTVRLLEGVQARSGGAVWVVFDGQDAQRGPRASRAIRVHFSASGQTADELIGDLVAAAPIDRPVVVVSSDRAVQRHARALGAAVMSSTDLLAVAT